MAKKRKEQGFYYENTVEIELGGKKVRVSKADAKTIAESRKTSKKDVFK